MLKYEIQDKKTLLLKLLWEKEKRRKKENKVYLNNK